VGFELPSSGDVSPIRFPQTAIDSFSTLSLLTQGLIRLTTIFALKQEIAVIATKQSHDFIFPKVLSENV
jgi:hypothetical protein